MTIRTSKVSDATYDAIAKLEEQLRKTVLEIYEKSKGARRFTPLYPWLLVRVLPKLQEVAGNLVLPQTQNKVMYEGIVLATWQAHIRRMWHKPNGLLLDKPSGHGKFVEVEMHSNYSVGDRIIFPHFEGQPYELLTGEDKQYRLVREVVDLDNNPRCGTYGKIDYLGDKDLKGKLDRLFTSSSMITVSGE